MIFLPAIRNEQNRKPYCHPGLGVGVLLEYVTIFRPHCCVVLLGVALSCVWRKRLAAWILLTNAISNSKAASNLRGNQRKFDQMCSYLNLKHKESLGLALQHTGSPSSQCEECFFFNLYANVQGAKRDTVTADIYYYITTEFGYAKRDLRLAVCGGVVLQQFEFIKVCMGTKR